MITMNRRDQALAALDRLAALPERPPLVVVDQGSMDGTADAVSGRHPTATVLPLRRNHGAAGRNIGVALATTPYVAFSDDDSWWEPDALGAAAAILDAHPEVGLVAARMLVGPDGRDDPINRCMEASPLDPVAGVPYPRVLGFLACGSVVRRAAFLAVGGFDPAFQVGGEEELLALDLEAAGLRSVYAAEVRARHHPAPRNGDDGARARRQARNVVWVPWMRLPVRQAAAESWGLIRSGWRDPCTRGGLVDAARGWGKVRARRRLVPPAVQEARRNLRAARSSAIGCD
jgi:GT2 family glycosyltransferase